MRLYARFSQFLTHFYGRNIMTNILTRIFIGKNKDPRDPKVRGKYAALGGITGIILTKLDGTAKGGVVLAIKDGLGIPVKYIGVGEQIDDLQPFNAQDFARALFDNTERE